MTGTAHIVVGLAWGDESKGATTDLLATSHNASRVIRTNGGQQAGHNVVVDGVHHEFQSFTTGAMSGRPSWWSHYCTVEPWAALQEMAVLRSKGLHPDRVNVDRNCLVTTGLHISANIRRERARGGDNHGSTGRGFGETIGYSLDQPDAAPRMADLEHPARYLDKIHQLAAWYDQQGLLGDGDLTNALAMAATQLQDAQHVFRPYDSDELLEELQHGHTLFEGAQGFWLDENYGTQPHTTWSTTTPANARRICRQAGIDPVVVGCLRTYATRHGAGPLPGEGQLDSRPPEPHNWDDSFAGLFRVAPYDVRYIETAIDITAVDYLAVSHLDVYSDFQTLDGPMPLDSFAPVLITANGQDRACRTIHPVTETVAA